MKKYLLSTSALASVALISSLASAEVELGGQVEFNLKSGDTHAGQALNVDDADLYVSGTTTTDGGLEVTGKFNLEGKDSGAIDVDNKQVIFSGGFGSIKLHDGDAYSGAAGSLGIYAASVAAGTGGVDGNAFIAFGPTGYGLAAPSDNGTAGVDIYNGFGAGVPHSITYMSNNFSGLTFGLSMYFGESGIEATSGQEIGVAYNADIGPGSLGASFTSASRTVETYDEGFAEAATQEDSESKSGIGFSYSAGAISFAFAQISTASPEDIDGNMTGPEASSTHLGFAYNFGPGNVSYTSITTDYTLSDTTEIDTSASTSAISVDYGLGEGVTLTLDSVSATNIDLDTGEEDGEGEGELVLGVTVSF